MAAAMAARPSTTMAIHQRGRRGAAPAAVADREASEVIGKGSFIDAQQPNWDATKEATGRQLAASSSSFATSRRTVGGCRAL
jgi:hypothetical protein